MSTEKKTPQASYPKELETPSGEKILVDARPLDPSIGVPVLVRKAPPTSIGLHPSINPETVWERLNREADHTKWPAQIARLRELVRAKDEALQEVMRPYGIYDQAVSTAGKVMAQVYMETGDKCYAALALTEQTEAES